MIPERAEGCLVGLAVGDALGFPLEGLTARRIEKRFGAIQSFRFLGPTGYVSDDTEQAVMAAEALLEAGLDPERARRRFARKLVGWFWTFPPGIGGATLRACLKLTVGLPGGVSSAGNGAAMRSAPLGLLPDAIRDETVRRFSQVTHTDPRGVDGARVVAAAVARLVRGEGAALPDVLQDVAPVDQRLEEALTLSWEVSRAGAHPAEVAERVGRSGYVLHSVPLAFSGLWRDPADFMEGLQAVVLAGGDADSNGAIAGALLGTKFGRAAIPASLRDALEPAYAESRLIALASGLLKGKILDGYSGPGFLGLRRRELAIKWGVALHVLARLLP